MRTAVSVKVPAHSVMVSPVPVPASSIAAWIDVKSAPELHTVESPACAGPDGLMPEAANAAAAVSVNKRFMIVSPG